MKSIINETLKTLTIGLASIFVWEYARDCGVEKEITHDRPQTIIEVQTGLVELGYLNDKADGICGPKTKEAWTEYSKVNNELVEMCE